ncbi:MAG: FAD-dependent oxidoreductase [Chloroflexota bacterium]
MDPQRADVVIVGSGVGGSTTALALARQGADVLVVERGERIPREPQNWDPRAVFRDGRYKPSERWLDGKGRAFRPGVHYVVGGNTKVYGASLPRFREHDFEPVEHLEGTAPAWPFSYADLEPYYDEAERIYNVHGSTGEDPTEPWRSGPYPFPAVPHEPYVADLADRLAAAGVHPSSTSAGIDLRDGGACIRCATCDGYPCKVGAKSDAEVNALDPAIAAGNVRLLPGTRVQRIETDRSGRRVERLVVKGPHGEGTVGGAKFVLAAGAINSAALLLASADQEHPHGLANSSGQVGRNFMMHNNAHLVCIDIDRRNDVVFQKTLSVNDWYRDGGDGYPLGSMQLIGKVQGVMMKNEASWAPQFALDAAAARSVEWLVMSEDLPHPDNRVSLTPGGRIVTAREPRGFSTFQQLHGRARQLFRSVGYDIIFTQHFGIEMNSHQCGTVVAGEDPATSVLDPLCRTHDIENLWVVDGGFFPSSAAMNPALTIAAQALRVAAESDLAR